MTTNQSLLLRLFVACLLWCFISSKFFVPAAGAAPAAAPTANGHSDDLMDSKVPIADSFDNDDDSIGADEVSPSDIMNDLHSESAKEAAAAAPGAPAKEPEEPKIEVQPYQEPPLDGIEYSELFEGGEAQVFKRWRRSSNPKFTGNWSWTVRAIEGIRGDHGLRVMDEAKHHGIASRMTSVEDGRAVDEFASGGPAGNRGKTTVVSYEVLNEENLNCGGGYLKLFNHKDLKDEKDMGSFDNETPYVVMFGPDRCGSTNKVHFIIKQLNPVSNKWEEHHLADPPKVPFGMTTSHVYSFVVRPDDTYEIILDNKSEKSGSLNSDFDPPFTPPKEIDDMDDVKPSDWVDEVQIPDLTQVKPDDWDEDAPALIADPSAAVPDGWLLNESKEIPDISVSQPPEWNEEEDGPWSPPLVPNPACAADGVPGCGEWKPPMIPNPAYKGKWVQPMIDNPAYKGPWVRKKKSNPEYFVSEHPHALAAFDSVGIELWTMQNGILFDNIVVSRSEAAVKLLGEKTWAVRYDTEAEIIRTSKRKPGDSTKDKSGAAAAAVAAAAAGQSGFAKTGEQIMAIVRENPTYVAIGGTVLTLVLLLSIIKLLKRRSQKEAEEVKKDKPEPIVSPKQQQQKQSRESTSGRSDDDENDEEEEDDDENEDAAAKKDSQKPPGVVESSVAEGVKNSPLVTATAVEKNKENVLRKRNPKKD